MLANILFNPRFFFGVNERKSILSSGLSEVRSRISPSSLIVKILLFFTVTVFSEKEAMAPINPIKIKNRITWTIIIPTIVARVYFKKLFISEYFEYLLQYLQM